MKKWRLHFLLAGLLLALPALIIKYNGVQAIEGITWGIKPEQSTSLPEVTIHEHVNYGVYDHEKKFSQAEGVAFEHFFYQWNNFNQEQFEADMAYASRRNRWPIITIEPYPQTEDEVHKTNLFADIVNGFYDNPIYEIREALKKHNQPVFIRWGHEMENVTGRYPWARDDYKGYINAYRYFYQKMKDLDATVYFVWSPVGNKELFHYWPGPDYVDYIGVSVYAFPEWDLDYFDEVRSFKEIFSEKYERVKVFGKPIIIAELGVTGEKSHQAYWMYEAFKSLPDFPMLKSIIYFNAKDSELAWDKKYAIPDWHIDSTLFDQYEYSVSF